ncbi:cytochrome-c peroxidase [Veronia pacifica]|uniref:Cytochrome-c peroxidase n=2 Tax=Veronia pacifica TaxID=1080227 RepID=A0A1C3EJZ0_9GAMM|nr:cytochrome-c peroxidase [Veronia pacifica]
MATGCRSWFINEKTSITSDKSELVRDTATIAGFTGSPADGRTFPDISEPLPQLGMKLFFSKSLSGNKDTACASCHHPTLGGGDNMPLPVGVDATVSDLIGPGRTHSPNGHEFDGGPTVPRNAPTSFNIALWDDFIFHDGRIESMSKTPGQNGASMSSGIKTPDNPSGAFNIMVGGNLAVAQARFPVTSKEEMKGFSVQPNGSTQDIRDLIVNRLTAAPGFEDELPQNYWLEEFQTAFSHPSGTADQLITDPNIFHAIGEYQRSMVFVDSPWLRFMKGDNSAIDQRAKEGALLFFRSSMNGGAGCSGCHSGNTLTDEKFHVLSTPQIGRGKEPNRMDQGRWYVTKEESDRFAFRTPSLLNVEKTGPYFHAGTAPTLRDAVIQHIDPQSFLDNYSINHLPVGTQIEKLRENTEPALQALTTLRSQGKSKLPQLNLSDADINNLVAFLESLTDPCVNDRQCLSKWIPTGRDPDGLRLFAKDVDGNPL